jgi:hypothetical protein
MKLNVEQARRELLAPVSGASSLSDLRVRIKINAPGWPLSRFY